MAFSRLQVTSCHYTGRYVVVYLHHDEHTTATAVREAGFPYENGIKIEWHWIQWDVLLGPVCPGSNVMCVLYHTTCQHVECWPLPPASYRYHSDVDIPISRLSTICVFYLHVFTPLTVQPVVRWEEHTEFEFLSIRLQEPDPWKATQTCLMFIRYDVSMTQYHKRSLIYTVNKHVGNYIC